MLKKLVLILLLIIVSNKNSRNVYGLDMFSKRLNSSISARMTDFLVKKSNIKMLQ